MNRKKDSSQGAPQARAKSVSIQRKNMNQDSLGSLNSIGSYGSKGKDGSKPRKSRRSSKIYDDPAITRGYDSVPLIEVDQLPRGGISLETKALGRIQFGIPPETIKDSMLLGIEVPSVYIVPIERFCREMGPALGINLAEFEFPAYFNYFIRQKRCTLVVDSEDAERDIRQVFGETLLGPEEFRDHSKPTAHAEEDFDPSYERDRRPNFYKEFYNFRTAEASSNYQELTIDTLLEFCHFSGSRQQGSVRREKLGVPPVPAEFDIESIKMELRRRERMTRRRSLVSRSEATEEVLDCISEDNLEQELSDDVSAGHRVHSKQRSASFSRRNSNPDAANAHLPQEESPPTIMPARGRRSSMTTVVRPKKNIGQEPMGSRRSSMPFGMESGRESVESSRDSNGSGNNDVVPFTGGLGAIIDAGTANRRGSMVSEDSDVTVNSRSRFSMASRLSLVSGVSLSYFDLMNEEDHDLRETSWMYSQVKWLGEVTTVYPSDVTEEQKRTNLIPRVEIFKMAGGTEYIVHDVNKDNIIVGKAKFSGTVRIPDQLSVEGFISKDINPYGEEEPADTDIYGDSVEGLIGNSLVQAVPPTFHPPSFGLTVLGNSHGFDKNGSTSGYVLWVNGRGIMIDPPPYSSATLEREGIRPQMIMAIIITHCHADHDAGAFQKVMTGAPVAIITTPTIYKSFIRKYAALSGLRPSLLRHSHRHRPAIVGQPLRFQGAIFHFKYTLHTIPCISFKVEWRGRSMVFTGDHLNSPPMIDALESRGILSKGRADDLRQLPIQPCDVLLHEAGAPPIHTPLNVLKELPPEVKARLYVVHTSAIPPDSGLRVAPTGTAGTIRIDSLNNANAKMSTTGNVGQTKVPFVDNKLNRDSLDDMSDDDNDGPASNAKQSSSCSIIPASSTMQSPLTNPTEATIESDILTAESLQDGGHPSLTVVGDFHVSSRSSLPKFDGKDGRPKVPPLVFLRPTDVSDAWFILNLLSAIPFFSSLSYANTMEVLEIAQVEMYCAGDVVLSAARRKEVLCVFWEGTCVERCVHSLASEVSMFNEDAHEVSGAAIWHAGDWTGPLSLQPDILHSSDTLEGEQLEDIVAVSNEGVKVIVLMIKDLQTILRSGSKLFRKYLSLTAKQEEKKKTRTSIKDRLSFHRSNNYEGFANDGLLQVLQFNSVLSRLTALQLRYLESLAEGPRYFQGHSIIWRVGDPVDYAYLIVSGTATLGRSKYYVADMLDAATSRRGSTGAITSNNKHDFADGGEIQPIVPIDPDKLLENLHPNSEYARLEVTLKLRLEEIENEENEAEKMDQHGQSILIKPESVSNLNRDRFANKVLARLYARRAYTAGLTFSRGIFLSDTSRMVSGDLASINRSHGDSILRDSIAASVDHHCHTSNMSAGPEGCIVLVFPRATLVPFLNSNPGVLLCMLGTQVLV